MRPVPRLELVLLRQPEMECRVDLVLEEDLRMLDWEGESLSDGLSQHVLQGGTTGTTLLESVGRDLDCESSRLTLHISWLRWNGDLDRYQAVGVGNDHLLSAGPWSPSSRPSHL